VQPSVVTRRLHASGEVRTDTRIMYMTMLHFCPGPGLRSFSVSYMQSVRPGDFAAMSRQVHAFVETEKFCSSEKTGSPEDSVIGY
jgi:hypothetical protein